MDVLLIFLCNLIRMNPPITFRHHNHLPGFQGWVDRTFPGVHALNYAHSGRVLYGIDGSPLREIHGPVAWWTWPGPRFVYGWRESPTWDHRYVTFHGPWAEDLAGLGWFPTQASSAFCPISNADSFRLRMDRLFKHVEDQQTDRAWVGLLDLLQTIRDEQSEQQQLEPRVKALRNLMAAIHERPAEDWRESAAAQSCGISPPHFRRLFRAEAGLPFWKYVCAERMALAASCLRRGSPEIKEIAELCRMPDVYHFSRMFRARYGQPPARYRQELRNP